MKSSASFSACTRRVTMRPSAVTGSKLGSEDEAGGAHLARERGVDELELAGHRAREFHARARALPRPSSIRAAPGAREIEFERFGNGDSTARERRPGTCAASSASIAGRSVPRQLPASSTSRLSPSRCSLRCMSGASVTRRRSGAYRMSALRERLPSEGSGTAFSRGLA